jgi:hypothetical protein
MADAESVVEPDLEPSQVAIKLKFREEVDESGEGRERPRTGGGGRRGGAS